MNVNSLTGSDSNTYAQVAAGTHQWQTIGRAAWGSTSYSSPNASQAAQAGDTVLVAAGTYTTSGNTSGTRWTVALNPANDGTSESPITFRGVGTVYIRMDGDAIGPMIGCDDRDYILWDNFYIDDYYGGSVSDTGPVVFHVATGCKLTNSTVVGHPGSYYNGQATFTDNYNGVRLEFTTSITISNNTIRQFTEGNHNQAGTMLYAAVDSIIEHNYYTTCRSGVYVKGLVGSTSNSGTVIRFNWFEGNGDGVIPYYYSTNTHIYQNVFKENTGSSIYADPAGYSQANGLVIANNTIVGGSATADYGIFIKSNFDSGANSRFYNNIIYGAFTYDIIMDTGVTLNYQDYEHNVYYGFNSFGLLGSTGITFSNWTTTYAQDNSSPAGINQDPLFVDTTYYKLQAGSPALTLGVDILDLDGDGQTNDTVPAGAYITGSETIGIESSGSTPKVQGISAAKINGVTPYRVNGAR